MDTGGIVGAQLRSFVERAERLNEERDAINDDLSEVYKEAKGRGLDPKIIKIVIKRRRMGKDQCDEEDTAVALYERALEEPEAEDDPRAQAGGREETSAAVRDAVADFVRDVPEDTTVSIATADGKGFAVTNKGGVRTVRQFGDADAHEARAMSDEVTAAHLADLAAAQAMLQDPFAAGKRAALQGDDETRNPFPHPSLESADWLRGHGQGVREREAARAKSGKRRRRQATSAEREGAEATV